MHVAIRADGGPDIGYGHLMRSNALAEVLQRRGHELTVATTTPRSAKSVFPETTQFVTLPSRGDPDPFVDWLSTTQPDAVVTDAYPIDTAYQRAIREYFPLAVLQDDARHPVCADLFINGNLYAADLEYTFIGDDPNVCLGPEYVLLRQAVRSRADADPPWRDPPQRAIIMMGGSDIRNLTPTALRAFDGLDVHVDVIVGPGVSEAQENEIRSVATAISPACAVACDPEDLVERMFQADFAVSTASSTTYELLALGTPIISIPVVDNQEPIAEALRRREVANVLNRELSDEVLRQMILSYYSDPDRRQRHQSAGQQLVDGQGVERVYAELLSIADSDC